MSGRVGFFYFLSGLLIFAGAVMLLIATIKDPTVPTSAMLAEMETITGQREEGERIANLPKIADKITMAIVGSSVLLAGFAMFGAALISHSVEAQRAKPKQAVDPDVPSTS